MENIVVAKEYDYYERKKTIDSITERYSFVRKEIIGKSCGGKGIPMLKIGSGNNCALIVAGVHGSERITSTVLLMFIEELCSSLQNDGYLAGIKINRALMGRGIMFVPCLNPDGCDISLLCKKACGEFGDIISKLCKNNFQKWNANLRGVDINHNFNADWENLRNKERALGIYGASPTRFGGTKPESEPETVAVVNLCRDTKIRHAVALHSQGEVIY